MARGLWRSQVAHRTFNPVVVGPNPTRPASFHGTKIDPLVLYSQMKISFESIDQQNDPFQLFIDLSKMTKQKESMFRVDLAIAEEKIDRLKQQNDEFSGLFSR